MACSSTLQVIDVRLIVREFSVFALAHVFGIDVIFAILLSSGRISVKMKRLVH